MKIRTPMAFHSKPETVPGYALCPHHGSEGIYLNTVTRFYQCQAITEPGDAGYSPCSTFNGMGVCYWQVSQKAEYISDRQARIEARREESNHRNRRNRSSYAREVSGRCPTCQAYLPDSYTPDMQCCLCLIFGPPVVRNPKGPEGPGDPGYGAAPAIGISVVGDWKEPEKEIQKCKTKPE